MIFLKLSMLTLPKTLWCVAMAVTMASLPLDVGAAPEALLLPIVKQPLTLTWFANFNAKAAVSMHSYAEQSAYQVLAERTGIRVRFDHPPLGAERERFNLLAVSGKYPDVIEADWFTYPGGSEKALRDGVIVPLNDLIRRHAPNFQALLDANPEVFRQVSTADGRIYAFPMLRLDPEVRNVWGPQIRADWLEKLGLAAPDTIDDWYRVLKAFRTRDPNGNGKVDEIPFSVLTINGDRTVPGLPAPMWVFLGGFGLAPEFFRRDGTVHYSPAEPAYRDFLATMRRWYAEGLIDPDYVAQTERQFDARMTNNLVGAYAGFNGGGLARFTSMNRQRFPGFRLVAVPYPSGPHSAGRHYLTWPEAGQVYSGIGAAVSSQNRHVVETVKFLDYGYSKEGGNTLSYGREGLSYTMVDGLPRYTERVMHNPKLSVAEAIYQHARVQSAPLVQEANYLKQFYTMPEQREAVSIWAGAAPDLLLPALEVDPADARKFNAIMSDLKLYIAEMTTRFITGREPMENFGLYQAKLEQAGVQRAIGYMQKALDRYQSKAPAAPPAVPAPR
jgi:putative aldouronate transport system substrate-binding protein